MDRQAHVPAGHRPPRAVLHDSPSPAHAPPQGTNHSSSHSRCRRPHCLSTAPAPHQGSRAGSTQHGPGRVDPVTDAACTGLLAPLRTCLAATRTALAPHQRRTRDLGPDRHGTACMCSRSLTTLRAHLAAARTALAPHQRRFRGHGPDRLSTVRTGPTLPPAACTGQLAPLHACLAATRTTLALHRQCNRDLGPDQLTLSMHRVLTLTRIRLTSLPARPCRASHDPGRPSWPYHDLILTRP